MNYNLKQEKSRKRSLSESAKKLFFLMKEEKTSFVLAGVAIVINSILILSGPFIVGYTIDHYISKGLWKEVLLFVGILIVIYSIAFVANFFQMRLMGSIGQRVVFNLRNTIFHKLQELPMAFFNQNKAGDLISRINNDTELVNQFFAQYLTRFIESVFTLSGVAIVVLVINLKLGGAMLAPALGLWIVTYILGSWLKERNKKSLGSIGGMSAEIQESLNNFKVIVAFNRRDYFKQRFEEANENTFKANMSANIGNAIIPPLYDFATNAGQLIVLCYGLFLILQGNLTVGILISFLAYSDRFYYPLRQLATIWTSFQISLAALDRISDILDLESNLLVLRDDNILSSSNFLEFNQVSFKYEDASDEDYVLKGINFSLERGKTYALVGPTGGGKTTTASLMARLFDPTEGVIYLDRKDIRSYNAEERTRKIGFILQEPFLFEGTIEDNLLYGLDKRIEIKGFDELLNRFEKGLQTVIKSNGEGMSLGEKQIISFMRAVLRKPELLVLDEATANIDTVTESILEKIINELPKNTTKVIIAHRLNTIENADHIFFVNNSHITSAGSFDQAVEMLLHNKRDS